MAEGHRGRYRDRFNNESIDNIPEYAVLEKMLHGVIVRQDTSEMARTLIKEFTNLAGVIDAPAEELQKVKGVGPTVSAFLKSLPPVFERYRESKLANAVSFKVRDDIITYLLENLKDAEVEKFAVICLDGNSGFISAKTVFEGGSHPKDAEMKRIVDYAVASKATDVIFAHNHIGGELEVSDEDVEMTKAAYNMLDFTRIHLRDHIIIGRGGYISMARENKMPVMEKIDNVR